MNRWTRYPRKFAPSLGRGLPLLRRCLHERTHPGTSFIPWWVSPRCLVIWLFVFTFTWSRGEICSSRDDFIPVFSTGTKFHRGIKNPREHFILFCPGLKWHFSVPPYVWPAVNDQTVHISLRQGRPFCKNKNQKPRTPRWLSTLISSRDETVFLSSRGEINHVNEIKISPQDETHPGSHVNVA